MALRQYFILVLITILFSKCSFEEGKVTDNSKVISVDSITMKQYRVLNLCDINDTTFLRDVHIYALELINLIDDTTSKNFIDFSDVKYIQSNIPSKEGFVGLQAMCILERILQSEDSILISKEFLCRRCTFLNKKIEMSLLLNQTTLRSIKSIYTSWYRESLNLTWDERRTLWKTKYSESIPKNPLN